LVLAARAARQAAPIDAARRRPRAHLFFVGSQAENLTHQAHKLFDSVLHMISIK
jgi:hypothetical protein